MKQDVVIIGSGLSRLVPVSQAVMGLDYSVTLAETPDVMERARTSALRGDGWLVVLLDGHESTEECSALLDMQPQTIFVTSPAHEALRRRLIEVDLPVVAEHEGPVPALATLLAMSRWAAIGAESLQARSRPGPRAEEAL